MLTYVSQYNISNGIFLTFDKSLNVRKLSSNHSQQVRDKHQNMFPYQKYDSWTKENFVILILYIMYNKKPPSFVSLIQSLYEVDKKDVSKFKSLIVNYEQLMARDIDGLVVRFGGKLTVDEIFNEYQQDRINFYTLWFYLQVGKFDMNDIEKSRIKGATIRRLRSLMMYLTFKQSSVEKISKIMNDKFDI